MGPLRPTPLASCATRDVGLGDALLVKIGLLAPGHCLRVELQRVLSGLEPDLLPAREELMPAVLLVTCIFSMMFRQPIARERAWR